MDWSICFVATELFDWGRFGGFGRCIRTIGAALSERSVRVSVVVPRGRGQKPLEELDGMTVHSLPLNEYPFSGHLYRRCDADVYHSEGLSWGSKTAMEAAPGSRHMVTFQNPRTKNEWALVNRFYPWRRRAFNTLFWDALAEAARRMDAAYCQARFVIPKVKALYGLDELPGFLPNPLEVPRKITPKADEPTVCFLGRFDGEKRPELFFELARRFPEVRFVALGRAHDEKRDRALRRRYGGIPNLEMPGFVVGKEKEDVLRRSWILVNTSVSECLPVSFLEAAAHGCAILSFHDPDGFASRFGYHAEDGKLDRGLRALLDGDSWKGRGERGFAHVSEVHDLDRVMDLHVTAYEGLLSGPK